MPNIAGVRVVTRRCCVCEWRDRAVEAVGADPDCPWCHGPTMVVYPDGTWYHGMTADRIPTFVRQHLIEGRPVEEWVFANNPLNDRA